ncbi:carbohydrate binding domain-containing protein [Dactylosporangium matsuzakiense]|uniref:carbohydrate binding domain-containing protein n=1 Tax=Dactylosporangium matsuzakiense TaxID=53360 RepID=UPI0021C272A1|nr:carbohydrate binding domain-containing protein [Dactylosporangium matsuzakiense]UWZ41135.1 carbohydrate binding domain-containing protein [Dactylosporangium matsuzakiense]
MRRWRGLAVAAGCASVAAVVGITAMVLPASAGANAVGDPGFESGLTGWSCSGTVSAAAGTVHSGAAALKASPGTADTAQCTQAVAVSPNTTYTLTAWVNGSYVYIGASGASIWTPSTGGAFQQLSTSFTTSATTTSVTVFVHGWYGQPTYYADDFVLTSGAGGGPTTTPPPTSTPPPASPSPSRSASPSGSPSRTASPSPTASTSPTGGTGPGAGLAACQFWSTVTPPVRTVGPSHDATSQAPMISLAGRLPAPSTVSGSLHGSSVTITFSRVAGAVAYRVWRNSQSVGWVDDWGQATLSVTDTAPCRNAHYTIAALRSDGSDASTGALSQPYVLADSGAVQPYAIPAGTRLQYEITSYNDAGQTASGMNTALGICAVDTRYIPWGTRFKVDGYGYCYAADIGTWIQGEIVDVWLPGAEADSWGVQQRTITIQ